MDSQTKTKTPKLQLKDFASLDELHLFDLLHISLGPGSAQWE